MKIRTAVHLGILERKGLLFTVLALAELGPEDPLGDAVGHSLLVGASLHPGLFILKQGEQQIPEHTGLEEVHLLLTVSVQEVVLDTILDLKPFAILCQGK